MSAKLFVGNLPFKITQSELSDLFTLHGNVSDVQLIMDRTTGRPRGFGFVTMGSDQEALNAVNNLNGKPVGGRPLTVTVAHPMQPRGTRSV